MFSLHFGLRHLMIKKLLGKYLSGEESILSSSFDAKRKYVSHVRSQNLH
jgi:hypothetical protein